jgi:hypothetical protein
LSDDLAFWGLVAVWELGYLKPTTWLRPRFWQVMWRRRDEIFSALSAARGGGSFFDRMANRFAEPDEGAPPLGGGGQAVASSKTMITPE